MQNIRKRFHLFSQSKPSAMLSYSTVRPQSEAALYFLHIPKTAGSSLTAILDNQFDTKQIFPHHQWDAWALDMTPNDFKKHKLYRGHFSYQVVPLLPKRLKIITVLRDPVQRVISQFKHHQRFSADNSRYHFFRTASILDALDDPWFSREYINLQTSSLGPVELLTPKTWPKFQSLQGEIPAKYGSQQFADEHPQKPFSLELAKERLDQMECFGFSERFPDFLRLLSYQMEWLPQQEVFANVAPEKSTTDEIDPLVYEEILEKNSLDAELYEYAKNRFDERLLAIHVDQLTHDSLYHRAGQRIVSGGRFAALRLDLDTPLPGTGWQPFEAVNNGHRWTGPETRSSLSLPLIMDQALKIRFQIVAILIPEMLNHIKLTVNGMAVPLSYQTIPILNNWLFEGVIPQEMLAASDPLTHLVFEVPQTVSPHDLNSRNGDTRKLGVAFDWLEITPAS